MSEDEGLTDVEGGPTWEELGHNLFKKGMLEYHTQIDKPDQMSTLDIYAEYVSRAISPKCGQILKKYAERKRTNMVPYKRERAKETERMVKGNIDKEREKKSIEEAMLGRDR